MKKSSVIFLLIILSLVVYYNIIASISDKKFIAMCDSSLIGSNEKDLEGYLLKFNKKIKNGIPSEDKKTRTISFLQKAFIINNTKFCDITIDENTHTIIDVQLSDYQEFPE